MLGGAAGLSVPLHAVSAKDAIPRTHTHRQEVIDAPALRVESGATPRYWLTARRVGPE